MPRQLLRREPVSDGRWSQIRQRRGELCAAPPSRIVLQKKTLADFSIRFEILVVLVSWLPRRVVPDIGSYRRVSFVAALSGAR